MEDNENMGRCDWRALFVLDPANGRYSLMAGATPDDVERRYLNFQRAMAESERRNPSKQTP